MRFAAFALVFVTAGCAYHHEARLASSPPPPPPVTPVLHTGKLLIELRGLTAERQCREQPGAQRICFSKVRESLGNALEHTLWPSFPHVAVKRKADNLAPGDYLLMVRLDLEALPPDDAGPGWSAGARGSWQLVRDGVPLAGEAVSSRSRAEFAYGAPLATGASEAVDAIAVHVASIVSELPETRPERGVPLPAVATGQRVGPLLAGIEHPCQPRSGAPSLRPLKLASLAESVSLCCSHSQSSDDASRCSMASR